MKYRFIFLFFLLSSINLTAQVKYDTIPSGVHIIGDQTFEEQVIFKDFNSQLLTYFKSVNLKSIPCYGKRVYVSTVFGSNGKLKNTSITKSVNPVCDSIAFCFVANLKDWLPGLLRGWYVDIPFLFPITFDTSKLAHLYSGFFDATTKEYAKRKEYFDFANSQQYDQKIINDFDFFKKYMAEVLRQNEYVYILKDYKLRRKESVVLQFSAPDREFTHLLVSDAQKNGLLYEYSLKNGPVRVPRDRKLLIIIYQEGSPPLLQTNVIYPTKDTVINLKTENYTKGRLLDEINHQVIKH
jgi:hypothetical protein